MTEIKTSEKISRLVVGVIFVILGFLGLGASMMFTMMGFFALNPFTTIFLILSLILFVFGLALVWKEWGR